MSVLAGKGLLGQWEGMVHFNAHILLIYQAVPTTQPQKNECVPILIVSVCVCVCVCVRVCAHERRERLFLVQLQQNLQSM